MEETKSSTPKFAGLKGMLIKAAIFIAIGLVSFFVLGSYFSDPNTYADIVSSLDEKRTNIMALIAGTAGASALIGGLGGNAGAPIANELMNMSSNFAVILAAIYLEKYLLTLLGALAFKIMIPVACLGKVISLFMNSESPIRASLSQIATKVALLGLALVLVVPCSVLVSNKIENTHEAYQAIEAENPQETAATDESASTQEEENSETENVEGTENAEESESGFFTKTWDTIKNLKDDAEIAAKDATDSLTGKAKQAISDAESALNDLVESFAIMIVTSCLIPILMLVLFLWIINTILGTNLSLPAKKPVKPFKTKETAE